MSLVELIVRKPLVTIEVELVRRLPLLAHTVIPVLKNFLVLVEVGMAAPSLEDFQAFHTLEQALLDFHAEAITIWLSSEPKAWEAQDPSCLVA